MDRRDGPTPAAARTHREDAVLTETSHTQDGTVRFHSHGVPGRASCRNRWFRGGGWGVCNGDRVSAGDDDKVLKPAVTAAQHADVPDAAEPCSGGWPQRQPLRSVHFAEVTKRTVMKPGSRGAASARAHGGAAAAVRPAQSRCRPPGLAPSRLRKTWPLRDLPERFFRTPCKSRIISK